MNSEYQTPHPDPLTCREILSVDITHSSFGLSEIWNSFNPYPYSIFPWKCLLIMSATYILIRFQTNSMNPDQTSPKGAV